MRLIPDHEFLAWAAEAGLVPDARYPHSKQLVYPAAPDTWRFWVPTVLPGDLPGFVSTALQLASASGPWRLRPRGGGFLHFGEHASFRERLIEFALRGLEVPDGAEGALEFEKAEWGPLLYLATIYYTFGWHVGTDVEIIPADRRCCLMLGHHGELTVQFASEDELALFEAGMAAKGYPLPDEPPDSTFKRPPWMRPE